jgi:hypothetical protein
MWSVSKWNKFALKLHIQFYLNGGWWSGSRGKVPA